MDNHREQNDNIHTKYLWDRYEDSIRTIKGITLRDNQIRAYGSNVTSRASTNG